MATSDKELETNLSDELPSKEKESKTISHEEKDVGIWNQSDAKTCSNDDNVDSNEPSCLAKDDQKCAEQSNNDGLNTEGSIDYDISGNVIESLESEKQACSDTGSVEVEKLIELNKNSPPLARSSGRKVDEALLEEDEMGCSGDEEEHYESAEEEHLTPEEAEERMKEALELKKEGNDHFRKQEYFEGKDLYTKAIKRCPKEFTENKSIFYANRAACFQKLEDYENAISDCSAALELAPNYSKARLRRAQCYEKVEKLEEALEDYKIVFENDKSSKPAREAISRLPEEIRIKHEKLKEEMIGKLKDLGNMVLRPFGLSTDNFKLQQDPNSGGYSINFQK